jgi:hypothetical protein
MFKIIILTVIAGLKSRRQLALENIALRHQLEVLQRNARRPSLRPSDRALWALLKRFLPPIGDATFPLSSPMPSSDGIARAGVSTGVGEATLDEAAPRCLSRSVL